MYLWEAEDWDFTNGMYLDNPALCSATGDPNCYFGKVGVEGVDEHNTGGASGPVIAPVIRWGRHRSGDYSRQDHFAAGGIDYASIRLTTRSYVGSEWVNYTRDWPNSTNWVIGRLSTDIGLSGSLTLSVVNPDATTTDLGTFTINGGLGWSTFQNVYLKDTNGNNALVTLNGKQTLRVTSGGNLLPNFFMLVAAQARFAPAQQRLSHRHAPVRVHQRLQFHGDCVREQLSRQRHPGEPGWQRRLLEPGDHRLGLEQERGLSHTAAQCHPHGHHCRDQFARPRHQRDQSVRYLQPGQLHG